ncbi:MAG: LCP family protein [Clostridiaceae bacterium]|nr:LCP family protein [Clostridiaceae bacterium]
MKLFSGNHSDQPSDKPKKTDYDANAFDENAAPGAKSPRMPEDRAYSETDTPAPQGSLSKGMKIYLGIAVPLLALVVCSLLYVLFFVKPPSGENVTPTSTVPSTTTTTVAPATTTTPIATTTTAATTTTEATTEATTAALSEDEIVEAAIMELSEEATDIEAPEKGLLDNPRREGVYTILLVGLDDSGKRSDTIMMLTLDTAKKAVKIMSVPRDLMSTSKFGNVIKINAAYAQGIEETAAEVADVLGYTANRYVAIDYDAFERLIDTLGGIEINVFMDMQYTDNAGNLNIDIKEGLQTLDGETALKYVRFRSGYAAADIKRIEIQQEFFAAVLAKLASPQTILKVPELVELFRDSVETDLTAGELIWLALQYYDMDPADIEIGKVPTHSVRFEGQDYEVAYLNTLLRRVNEGGYNPYVNAITEVNLTLPPEDTATGSDVPAAATSAVTTGASTAAETTTAQTTAASGNTPPSWLGG